MIARHQTAQTIVWLRTLPHPTMPEDDRCRPGYESTQQLEAIENAAEECYRAILLLSAQSGCNPVEAAECMLTQIDAGWTPNNYGPVPNYLDPRYNY